MRTSKQYFGQFHCAKCKKGEEAKRRAALAKKSFNDLTEQELKEGKWTDAKAKELDAALAAENETAEHQILREKQQAYLKHVRHEAIQSNPKRLLVIMDFSKFNLKQNITQSTEEKKGKPETVHEMI